MSTSRAESPTVMLHSLLAMLNHNPTSPPPQMMTRRMPLSVQSSESASSALDTDAMHETQDSLFSRSFLFDGLSSFYFASFTMTYGISTSSSAASSAVISKMTFFW